MSTRDDELMRLAIKQAEHARAIDEVPIGCVIEHAPTGRIVGVGHNQRERLQDPLAHAELLAIRQAAETLGSWRLLDCTLVVTLEPCPMCAGAIVNARIRRLVFGCTDPKAGAVETLYRICTDERLNHRVQVATGVLSETCASLLRDFFRDKRHHDANG